ncbi:hypothetical protein AAFF_G00311250 [Aldrovandia affinis]|uniref:Uncharacterized protein n=1 Tax=Aldrovandia affinis TaxID=143900 RepID=A0AAD7R7L3_9TELE|nr:hypothetical protein AAFF_G00311250 [Aldrovandia affinis]
MGAQFNFLLPRCTLSPDSRCGFICEVDRADVINFDDQGVISYRFKMKKMKILKDVIKTSESEGVILHGEGQQGDYITLELKRAELVLQINLAMIESCILQQLSFGGMPYSGKPSSGGRKNFKGCMESINYNGDNITDLARRRKQDTSSFVGALITSLPAANYCHLC